MNFLGFNIARQLFLNERENFRRNGFRSKLLFLHRSCDLADPNFGARPYLTIEGLNALRDAIAHPKIVTESARVSLSADQELEFPLGVLPSLVSADKAHQAVDDVGRVADALHSTAIGKFPECGLTAGAFDGPIVIGTGSVSIPPG